MDDAIVLCYHALSPTWDAVLSTTPERFERQIALLARRGYRGVTFSEVADPTERNAARRAPAEASGPATAEASGPARREASRRVPDRRRVAVTFDDAYRSVLEHALPILRRYEMPATVFAPTDFVGSGRPMRWSGIDRWLGGAHERELTPMSWEQLRELAAAGWEIGSHTGSHPRLTQLDDAALADELARSKHACERQLGMPCTSLAYPYGDVDARVAAAAARAGYRAAAALPANLRSRDPLQWPRIGVYWRDDDRRFRLKVSPTVRRLRNSPLWDALDGARRSAWTNG